MDYQFLNIVPLLTQFVIVIGFAYLCVLLYRFLKKNCTQSTSAKENSIIVAQSTEPMAFIKDDKGNLIINMMYVKIIYREENDIYVEMITNDIYKVKECRSSVEAEAYLELYDLNVDFHDNN